MTSKRRTSEKTSCMPYMAGMSVDGSDVSDGRHERKREIAVDVLKKMTDCSSGLRWVSARLTTSGDESHLVKVALYSSNCGDVVSYDNAAKADAE